MSKPRTVTYIDGRLAFAQMDDDAKRVIVRAALSQHMRELGRRVDNTRPDKRAIISAAMTAKWKRFREEKEAARLGEIAKHGHPPDWTPPAKPRKKRVYSRSELLDILSAEMDRKFPNGITKENEKEFMNYKPTDPRLKGHV